jgi:DNA invertase Pin-like site-specific DNA recombinase
MFMMKAKPKDLKAPRNMAYLRVSTADQDCEKNKADILKFGNDRDFGKIEFVEEKVSGTISWKNRAIKQIIDDLGEGDRLIVPELSRLGRSMLEIMEMLSVSKQKGIAVYAVKGAWELNGSIQSKVMAMVFSMVSEIERDLISSRTKEGLRAARAAGKLLGRPRGPGKSKLDQYRPEIESLLKNGSTKTFIAARYGATLPTLFNWINKNKIDSKPMTDGRK